MIPALLALVAASLFTGAAVYISIAEHPARLKLDDAAALQQWKPSYARAVPMQAGLAIVGGLLGFWQAYANSSTLWLTGALLLFANVPFTLLIIMPTNYALKAIEPRSEPRVRPLLLKWGSLHLVRSLLGAASILMMLAAISDAATG
jgi:hypothetical protein